MTHLTRVATGSWPVRIVSGSQDLVPVTAAVTGSLSRMSGIGSKTGQVQ